MGQIIGKGRENLAKIEQKTGATLKVWEWNSLCVKGSPESQKRAIWEIKEQVVSLAMNEFIQQTSRLTVLVLKLDLAQFQLEAKRRIHEPHNQSDIGL